MTLWTVVIKTLGNINSAGEWPYMIRAFTEAEAVSRAREIHEKNHPTNKIRQVRSVVKW